MAKQPTTEKLALALTNAKAPQDMIEKARRGEYDEFKSDLAFPIRALVEDASRHHLHNIALRAMNGEFDASDEEADAWGKSAEGQATLRDLFEGKQLL